MIDQNFVGSAASRTTALQVGEIGLSSRALVREGSCELRGGLVAAASCRILRIRFAASRNPILGLRS